ncbi:RCC1 and BTB domain-containing protein 1-like [Augochlora pura]
MGDLKRWSFFNLLEPEILQTIRLAYIYDGDNLNILIVTNENKVFACVPNTKKMFELREIYALKGLHIKTMGYIKKPLVFILTYTGELYVINEMYYTSNNIILTSCVTERVKFPSDMLIKHIACGGLHCLALTFSDMVFDYDRSGEFLLMNDKMNIISEKIISISCGYSFCAVVTDDGIVRMWNYSKSELIVFEKDIPMKKVACGYNHFLALDNEGSVYTWGSNNYGQLGINMDSADLAIVPTIKNILDIATSHDHFMSIAMGKGNRIFVWGLCLGQSIKVPTLTNLSSIHDAFACYALPKVMHEPLVKNCNLNLIESLRNAFNNETTSNFTIKIHGESIHVHKSVVSTLRCSHFRKMFLKVHVDEDQCVIEEENFSYNLIKAFFQYLYTDKINVSLHDTLELLQLADYYSMDPLKRHCAKTICENLTVKDVLSTYSIAIKYCFKELENYCLKYALRNMTAVVKAPTFIELDAPIIKQFILKAAEARLFRS